MQDAIITNRQWCKLNEKGRLNTPSDLSYIFATVSFQYLLHSSKNQEHLVLTPFLQKYFPIKMCSIMNTSRCIIETSHDSISSPSNTQNVNFHSTNMKFRYNLAFKDPNFNIQSIKFVSASSIIRNKKIIVHLD